MRVGKLLNVKVVLVAAFVFILTGCTGTTYNKDRSCTEDYLLVPALSLPKIIGACDSYKK